MMRSKWLNRAKALAMLLAFAAVLPAVQAQGGKMGGMGSQDGKMGGMQAPQAMPGMPGQAGTASTTGAANAMPADTADFPALWRQALAGPLALNADRLGRLKGVLQGAAAKLAANWATLQEQLQREAAAQGDAKATLRKRIGLTDSERDLIVDSATTDLRDFLSAAQVDLVQTAAFHGVSRAHSEDAMPMTMGMGTGMKMTPMNGQEELMMRLATAALTLNRGFKAGSLEAILQDLGAR